MGPEFSFDQLPGSLPADCVPEEANTTACAAVVQDVLPQLGKHIEFLRPDVLWRDWMCFTSHVRTRSSSEAVATMWSNLTDKQGFDDLTVSAARVARHKGSSWVDVPFHFSTLHGNGLRVRCSGFASLVPGAAGDEIHWQIWNLVTVLENFEGSPSPDTPPPDKSKSSARENRAPLNFEAIVIGAGQSGLSVAGRLAALNISYLVLEKYSHVGASWIRRYDSIRQHTVREMGNLPFGRTFAEYADEEYLPGHKVAAGYSKWAEKYGINIWTTTQIESCEYDEDGEYRWKLKLTRAGHQKYVTARHIVMSIGGRLVEPKRPTFPGEDEFAGKIMHAADYRNCAGWQGLKAIIVGSATHAHDIAADMVTAGVKRVCMVQRGRTPVFPIKSSEPGQKAVFENLPTEVADRLSTRPTKIAGLLVDRGMRPILESRESLELFEKLEARGFKVDRTSKLYDLIATRGGGYYIDVGCSQLIADGVIEVKSGVAIDRFTKHAVVFQDGSEIEANIVVFATGFSDNAVAMGNIVGHKVAKRFGKFGGLNEEGEQYGAMREGGKILPEN